MLLGSSVLALLFLGGPASPCAALLWQVLAAITDGSVAPMDETLGKSYFAREDVQTTVADVMFNARGSFVTITGALRGLWSGNRGACERGKRCRASRC